MVNAFDVNPHQLIRAAANKLESTGLPAAPSWVGSVKSGPHAERIPQDEKFWYMRCASILYQAYGSSPIGVSSMRTHYGGRQNNGVGREHFRRSGGNMIRKGMQALEKAGLLTKKKVGRYISPKGQAFMDAVAKEVSGAKKAEAPSS